jgi:hypothetical protein
MTASPRRFPWTAAVSAVLLLAVFEYLFFIPLRPTAWGGPRAAGPFESAERPAAGRLARQARLYLEDFARQRSPDHPLNATAEAIAGYHALLASLRYGVLWLILWRLGGAGWLATLGVIGAWLPMALGSPRQTEADVGLLLFVLLLAATTTRRPPWWVVLIGVPILFAIWANAHTSVVVGFAWLAAITIGRTIAWFRERGRGQLESPGPARFATAIVVAGAAACINPDGPQLFVDAFAVTKNPNMAAMPWWQPIDFSHGAGLPWVYFTALALILIVQLVSSSPFSPTALVVVLSFGIWPLVQQRGSDYWWLVVPCLVMPHLSAIRRRWIRSDSAPLNPGSSATAVPVWLPVIAVGLAVIATPVARWLISGQPRSLASIASPDTPVLLAQELSADDENAGQFLPELHEQVRATYPGGRFRGAILCGESQGDFLAWILDGDSDRPVMAYSRPETFDPAHWAECRKALDGESAWWEILGRHQVNIVAIDAKQFPKLADRLRRAAEWRTVQDSPSGLLVSIRREPKLPVELVAP